MAKPVFCRIYLFLKQWIRYDEDGKQLSDAFVIGIAGA